jgi:hypothetical protein
METSPDYPCYAALKWAGASDHTIIFPLGFVCFFVFDRLHSLRGETLIVMLGGGGKSSQESDIAKAKQRETALED